MTAHRPLPPADRPLPTAWERLRHGGLLLDPPRLARMEERVPEPLPWFLERELRRLANAVLDDGAKASDFAAFVLEKVCGFSGADGSWKRGPQVGSEWSRRAVTGESIKPRHLWGGPHGALLPVFFDAEPRLGIGRSRRAVSHVLQWLRAGGEHLALLTNGRQWRLVFAGLDFDAWCEWDVELWFEEGVLSPQIDALRTLLGPELWTPPSPDAAPPLLEAVLDSRKGQAELSAVLGERVRESVELLVQVHGEDLKERCADVDPSEIYRAAVRVVMRMVVVLFAESRDLLPRENAFYHGAYGLTGLLEELEKLAARGGNRLARSWNAWPRVLALFRLVHQGSHHPALPVREYGGELFAPGDPESADGLSRALAVFESACFERELLPDRDVHRMLERITRTRVKVRQGRSATWVVAPVDFSDLSSEYIGILYEGLLDFELKTAPPGDPVVFLAVGNQPALPLSRLEAMDDKSLASLLEKMKDTSSGDQEEDSGQSAVGSGQPEEEEEDGDGDGDDEEELDDAGDEVVDERHATRTRAETWARRAVAVGKLARKPRGKMTPEKRLIYEESVARKARRLVTRVILPGEWYLVRWGGTRKGSGTFYTRPGLAVPTVQRTLRPLAYTPPVGQNAQADLKARAIRWTPKKPEEILELKVCDPACGSGTFPVAALRFLSEALYEALHHHERVRADGERAVVKLFGPIPEETGMPKERLGEELIPCRPDDPLFEPRLKAILRRHVVERCIYGVDLDPLAVELCRLSLWIETMDRTLPFSFLDHKIKCGNSLVGAWFDQFQHFPVMAWKNREAGDKNHTNGVHFERNARTRQIKAFVKEALTPDLRHFLDGRTLFSEDLQERAAAAHAGALDTLARLHELPVHDSAERARIYREELLDSKAYGSIREAMDLWCACWFWPADKLEDAPLPTTLAAPSEETRAVAMHVAANKRFFHWELEFPDVFNPHRPLPTADCRPPTASGFDAILGNPPWETLQPNSKEFFSNIDPLYRGYGNQEAKSFQVHYFEKSECERAWLDYAAGYASESNWKKFAVSPFGDPRENKKSQDRFAISAGKKNAAYHDRWRAAREKSPGFASEDHPFRHQGEGKAYTYKLFLEQAHALLRPGGRLGFIVPSGLYSDHGTGSLRQLFLDRCRWEWLFGFENRDKVFDIDSRFKFNPVVIEKGGRTEAIRTAFMRRKLEDWEEAETLATPYTREQVERFSPRSKAILEIQSRRDLEILEKIYANSVLLGDDGPDGWGIEYAQGDFNMTSDSKLFPPRPKWEAQGYRPDEYSRWLKGDWRPIEELFSDSRQLAVGSSQSAVGGGEVVPVEVELEEWLFESGVGPEEREARARRVHEHLLKPGDVQRTDWRLRCAQPPYDSLPIPRADIPAGTILSREADAWIHEDRVEDVALPFMQGAMLQQFDFSQKGWLSGTGLQAKWAPIDWSRKVLNPHFLMAESQSSFPILRTLHRRVARNTDARTMISCLDTGFPAGDKAPVLTTGKLMSDFVLVAALNSFVFDALLRNRCGSTNIDLASLSEMPLPRKRKGFFGRFVPMICNLACPSWIFAFVHIASEFPGSSRTGANRSKGLGAGFWDLALHERLRTRAMVDCVVAALVGLAFEDFTYIVADCDHPEPGRLELPPKGFWRVDKDKDPELRHTVLTLVAFHDLEEKIRVCGGDRDKGIEAFLNQNDGEGWMLPETLRLTDYGLGGDDRAKEHQPVASRLGPRFYDWQLAQTPEESWRECHLHACNLLGEPGYKKLLAEIEAEQRGEPVSRVAEKSDVYEAKRSGQKKLFD